MESGKPVSEAAGVISVSAAVPGVQIVEIGSGTYSFTTKRVTP
jgi:hypothetical protein